MLAESAGALAHFMDETFTRLLSESELRLRDALQKLAADPDEDSPVWAAFTDFLRRLGSSGAA